MFYTTDDNRHGLAHDPFKAIVSPRPIGWIGSKGRDGSINLAPYSFFNAVADRPKLVMFSSAGRKDSQRNAAETGVFTCNFVGRDLAEKMNLSSAALPYGESEFDFAGLTAKQAELIDAPYVGEAFAVLECRVTEIMEPKTLSGAPSENVLVFGEVVGIRIDETIVRNGRLDMSIARPVARMGYMDYSEGSDVFEMFRPHLPKV
ncbi:flavin reductase family protein [Rhizobium redzepovicii]|uniref:Flavin reductase family protein n=1 Tax=Rhizobium redzepovicii TaxID=2867518 RepID=A0AAW8P067_9HYPH|nr:MULTISPECIES: flavin reductase family protein [Rhizobium]MBB3522671.1 flavin reductase (DIM6/NTAB) family NADH-FMN oxidoreductase RutF [Rhizobium sp. BK456]MBY4588774.1 flavin reductase family protein [Rhizobium redzepovicii]MBY4617072.1 flavin reductase family protein [Rhizobium redzepovicii]MDF0658444.1 flavin reductase family protein [Rhizobium sp. BC49]MDR9760372.1 flavin reductase family protein [Rhizobium redzepovicii]